MREHISHERVIEALTEEYECGEIVPFDLRSATEPSMDESHEIELNPDDGTPEIRIVNHEDSVIDDAETVSKVLIGLKLLAYHVSEEKQCTVYPIFVI